MIDLMMMKKGLIHGDQVQEFIGYHEFMAFFYLEQSGLGRIANTQNLSMNTLPAIAVIWLLNQACAADCLHIIIIATVYFVYFNKTSLRKIRFDIFLV